MRRSSVALFLFASACARTGLLDFGREDGSGGDGAGGSAGHGGSVPTGGLAGTPNECATTSDCPIDDFCAPPICQLDGSGSAARWRCIATPVACDDGNPCTRDACDPSTGACTNDAPSDADRDGFIGRAPLDGPPSCGGEDCDDLDGTVHPGAREVCDGRDNDCDRAIDEDTDYTRVLMSPTPIVSPERGRAARGGLVFGNGLFAFTYNTTAGHKQTYFKLITGAGRDAGVDVPVSQINADAFSGPVEWSGSGFFTAFADARQGGSYEIYATRFDSDGQRVQADLRLTDAPDFSLNPVVAWTGEDYVVAWDDKRARLDGGVSQIFARRFSAQGMPIGNEVLVSPLNEWSEFPALVAGTRTLGLTYVSLGFDGDARAIFRTLDLDLGGMSEAVELPVSRYANSPSIAFTGTSYMVAWSPTFDDSLPAGAVHVAVIDEMGGEPRGGHPVTFGFSFTRSPALVSLGDRALLVFSGAGPDAQYDLYAKVVPVSLEQPASVPAQITNTQPNSFSPYAARGLPGTIGIVFEEVDPTAEPTLRRPHFMSVGCVEVVTAR